MIALDSVLSGFHQHESCPFSLNMNANMQDSSGQRYQLCAGHVSVPWIFHTYTVSLSLQHLATREAGGLHHPLEMPPESNPKTPPRHSSPLTIIIAMFERRVWRLRMLNLFHMVSLTFSELLIKSHSLFKITQNCMNRAVSKMRYSL